MAAADGIRTQQAAGVSVSLLAVDPGTTESGWAELGSNGNVGSSGVFDNDLMLRIVQDWYDDLAIEMISSQGMPVGRETFETVRWIGRFQQAYYKPENVKFVLRREVQLHLCGTTKAKDANIRQALIDIFGAPGVKAKPGGTYGVKSHAWAALGVAATVRKLTTAGVR